MIFNASHVSCVSFLLQTAIKMSGSTLEEELPANHTGQRHDSDKCSRQDLLLEQINLSVA